MTKAVRKKIPPQCVSRFDPENFPAQIEQMMQDGFTISETTSVFKCSAQTLYKWLRQFPQFRLACERGKSKCVHNLINSLYQMTEPRTLKTTITTKRDGKVVEEKTIIKEIEPNTHAIAQMLRYRDPDHWKPKTAFDINSTAPVTIVIEKGDDDL